MEATPPFPSMLWLNTFTQWRRGCCLVQRTQRQHYKSNISPEKPHNSVIKGTILRCSQGWVILAGRMEIKASVQASCNTCLPSLKHLLHRHNPFSSKQTVKWSRKNVGNEIDEICCFALKGCFKTTSKTCTSKQAQTTSLKHQIWAICIALQRKSAPPFLFLLHIKIHQQVNICSFWRSLECFFFSLKPLDCFVQIVWLLTKLNDLKVR